MGFCVLGGGLQIGSELVRDNSWGGFLLGEKNLGQDELFKPVLEQQQHLRQ
jgi:hypothetical protein